MFIFVVFVTSGQDYVVTVGCYFIYYRYSKEPMFIRKPRSSEAREGDTVIIACEVVGDPKPDVYWLRDFLKVNLLLYAFKIPRASYENEMSIKELGCSPFLTFTDAEMFAPCRQYPNPK